VLLAVLASGVAFLLVVKTGPSGPATPRQTIQEFTAANQRYDWETSWQLLCHSERLRHGSLDRYARTQDAAVAVVGPLNDGLTVTVGEARPRGRSSPQSYVVPMVLTRSGESESFDVLVVEEDGRFRACGSA
jgi:hypothetical protein